MTILTRPERLALLLNLLGDDAIALAKQGMPGGMNNDLSTALEDFKKYPPSQDEIDLVLDDFEAYFSLAMKAVDNLADEEADDEPEPIPVPKLMQLAEDQFDVEFEATKKFSLPKPSGNTILDLNRLHPYQVATALRHEKPEITAIVIGKLNSEHAAKTLENLPDAIRPGVFMGLAKPPATKPRIQKAVLEKTLELALLVKERETVEESSEKMATLMRSLPKSVRGPMLEQLAESDKTLADQVKKNLYQFDDISRLEDRDLQKILGQCQTDSLVVALQGADETLLGRILGNMSKRAKETLQEEMEFKTNAKPEEIDAGRAEVVAILVSLDESGEITME
ncbi:MAG: FliG C-terminal domain-containing protein [Pirellulaceae bacterium]